MAESGIIRVGFTHYGDANDIFGGRIPPHLEQLTMTLQTTSFDIAPSSGQSITKHIKEGIPYEWVWTNAKNLLSILNPQIHITAR